MHVCTLVASGAAHACLVVVPAVAASLALSTWAGVAHAPPPLDDSSASGGPGDLGRESTFAEDNGSEGAAPVELPPEGGGSVEEFEADLAARIFEGLDSSPRDRPAPWRPRGRRIVHQAGRVVDTAGRPIAGVKVSWVDHETLPAITDDDGRFAIPVVPEAVELVCSHPFRLEPVRHALTSVPGEPARIVYDAPTIGILQVTCPRPDGGYGACPTLLFLGHDRAATADENASWQPVAVSPGRWTVRAFAPASGLAPAEAVCDVQAEQVTELSIPLLPGGILEGVVVDADGAAVAGAKVRWRLDWPAPVAERGGSVRKVGAGSAGSWSIDADHVSASVRTSADGRFRLTGVPSNRVRLSVEHEGAVCFDAHAWSDAAPLRIVLPASVTR